MSPTADLHPSRRAFLTAAGAATMFAALGQAASAANAPRPNILWIVSEDNNPYLGCYGEPLAHTPTLDNLARQGILYQNCFSQAPVCAPTRFTIITGMYATSCGPAHHMRAQGKFPASVRGFAAYLRDAGYYCTNNAKTDYNAPIKMKDAWDESSRTAHWRNRPAGKPFFAVFNHEITHESQIFPTKQPRKPLPNPVDPAKVRLPAYHPDTPEFRADRAHYFEQMARLDQQVAKLLADLEADGLLEDTIIFYYGDNGGILPRSKRFPYDSGTHTPLILRFPKKYQHLTPASPGSRLDAPVASVDFAPTVLSLASVPIPPHMQGRAFAGPAKAPDAPYAFSFRNRMDERYDMIRTVRDKRYRYLRNYMPHLIYGQHVEFMFQMRSMARWKQLHDEGKLTGPQDAFWREKPEEELYDLQTDPDEVNNLAASPDHQAILQRMRQANEQHILRIRDNGFIPEGSPLEGYGPSHDPAAYPLERILPVANTVTRRDPANLPKLIAWMNDPNECIRYWAALGCVMLREKAAPAASALALRLEDPSGSVRVAAAEALCHVGQEAAGVKALIALLDHKAAPIRLQAANALQNLGEKGRPALAALRAAVNDKDDYVCRAARYAVKTLAGNP